MLGGGRFKTVLAVHNLASHAVLLALPVPSPEAAVAIDSMKLLNASYGLPLVLKSDNGIAFKAAEFTELMIDKEVTNLFSPAATPRYNGSIEAGMGPLTAGIFYHAAAHGRGDRWLSDDVEAAREQINHATCPWGSGGPTPWQQWQSRVPISADDHRLLKEAIQAAIREHLASEGMCEDEVLLPETRAAVVRAATRRALIELGYLEARRRRISPPFDSPLRLKIN